jgi:CelD/BcsL family acetyltransferase involved in cellulose biosynthesis
MPVSVKTYEIDPLVDSRWATLVDSHPRSSVFHSSSWLRALRMVYQYEPFVVTTCPPDARLTNAIVACRVRSWWTGRRLVSLPFSDHCEPLVDNLDQFDQLLLHLKANVDRGAWRYVEIRSISVEPRLETELGRIASYLFHRLDLTPSTGKLFQNFHKSCIQRKIRRSEREDLLYEEGSSEDLLQKFYRLFVITRRRQYLPPQPIGWFRGLITAFGKNIKIRVASKDGTSVASILTLTHRKSMIYKYGCSDPALSRLGGTALLFWKAIQEAKELGLDELDMGRSDPDNPGLIAFKEHWGATGQGISYWRYPHREATSPAPWKSNLVRRFVAITPNAVLKATGSILYKHMG